MKKLALGWIACGIAVLMAAAGVGRRGSGGGNGNYLPQGKIMMQE